MINIDPSGKPILITGALGAPPSRWSENAGGGGKLQSCSISVRSASPANFNWKSPPPSLSIFSRYYKVRCVEPSRRNLSVPCPDTVSDAGGCGLHPLLQLELTMTHFPSTILQVNLARALPTGLNTNSGHSLFTASSYVALQPHAQPLPLG
jgi:hypothetical protein